jgi:hypothetical protein
MNVGIGAKLNINKDFVLMKCLTYLSPVFLGIISHVMIVLITLFMVNAVGHAIYKETNIKNLGDNTLGEYCIPTQSR